VKGFFEIQLEHYRKIFAGLTKHIRSIQKVVNYASPLDKPRLFKENEALNEVM
jgi:hypothetical protein